MSSSANEISEQYNIDSRLSELIIQESDRIFHGFDGFVLTFKDGILVPNAGIDTSNIMPGYAILYPVNSLLSAKTIKNEIKNCLLYTSPSPRDKRQSRMPSSA